MKKKMYYLLRTLQILGLILVCTVILYQFSLLEKTANKVKYQQSEHFAASLINLAAARATRYLSSQKITDLEQFIDDLSADPMVRDAGIYDNLGKVIYQSKNRLPLANLLKSAGDNRQTEKAVPYIAELYKENKKIGYLRINLEQQKILAMIDEYQNTSQSTMLLLLILSLLAGTIIMALLFTRLENAYYYVARRIYLSIRKNRIYW